MDTSREFYRIAVRASPVTSVHGHRKSASKGSGLGCPSNGDLPSEQEKAVTAKRAPVGLKKPLESRLYNILGACAPEIDGSAMGAACGEETYTGTDHDPTSEAYWIWSRHIRTGIDYDYLTVADPFLQLGLSGLENTSQMGEFCWCHARITPSTGEPCPSAVEGQVWHLTVGCLENAGQHHPQCWPRRYVTSHLAADPILTTRWGTFNGESSSRSCGRTA